jgi:hypothetical protein
MCQEYKTDILSGREDSLAWTTVTVTLFYVTPVSSKPIQKLESPQKSEVTQQSEQHPKPQRKKAHYTVDSETLLDNPLITNADLVAMAFPARGSGGRHPSPVPNTIPGTDSDTSTLRRVPIIFYDDTGAHKKRKPVFLSFFGSIENIAMIIYELPTYHPCGIFERRCEYPSRTSPLLVLNF